MDLHAQPVYASKAIESMESEGFIFEPVDLPVTLEITKTLEEAIDGVRDDRLLLFGSVTPVMDRDTRRKLMEPFKKLGVLGIFSIPGRCYTGIGARGPAKIESIERLGDYKSSVQLKPWDYIGWNRSGCFADVTVEMNDRDYSRVTFTTPDRDVEFLRPQPLARHRSRTPAREESATTGI